MNAQAGLFVKQMLNPFQFKWFLFTGISQCYFSGVRVRELDGRSAWSLFPTNGFHRIHSGQLILPAFHGG
jgi:hypothetical protein